MEVTFRGKKSIVRAGTTLNIPSNAPHMFHNVSSKNTRLLCICSPAGQENFFKQIGIAVATRTTAPPKLDEEGRGSLWRRPRRWLPSTVPSCSQRCRLCLTAGRGLGRSAMCRACSPPCRVCVDRPGAALRLLCAAPSALQVRTTLVRERPATHGLPAAGVGGELVVVGG
jgi:hypothetical protein